MIFKYLLAISVCASTFAAGPNLDFLTQDQANAVAKEFSANFVHTTISPASGLGDIWGFEVGLIGGITKTKEIDRISKTYDASSDVEKVPHAALIGAVTIPFSLTAEINIIPEVKGGDIELQHTSLGVKWTFSDLISQMVTDKRGEPFELPVDLALRVHGSSNTLSYSDVINNTTTGNANVNANVSFKTKSFGYNLTLSRKILFVEPYIGIGRVSNDTDIKVDANTGTIFNFTSDQKYTAENSGTHFFLGTNVSLFFTKLGFEYSKIMSISRVSGKLSFAF